MESRLIFLHQNHCDGVTEKARSAAVPPFKVVGVCSWQIRNRAILERTLVKELCKLIP